MRVLAADDAAPIRALLELHLSKAGHRVDLVADGRAAAERYAPGRYDAVILDMKMPALDGPGAAREIRAREEAGGGASVPIVLLTAAAEAAPSLPGVRVLAKPFTRESLLACLPGGSPPPAADPDLADLVPIFLDSCRTELAELRRCAARRDHPALAAAGHKLVGSGASYGFPALSAAGRALEDAAKAGDDALVGAALEGLARRLEESRG